MLELYIISLNEFLSFELEEIKKTIDIRGTDYGSEHKRPENQNILGEDMLIRKNISLDDKYLKKLQPFLDANDGNLSAAVRDTIEIADTALTYHKSIDEAIKFLKETPVKEELSDTIKSGENTIINKTMLEWLFRYTKGRLTDEDLVNELINPFEISNMKELEDYLNRISRNYQWTIRTSIKCEDIYNPESALLLLSNSTINSREFFLPSL